MCPRCGNTEGGKVFVVGREERCEKCYKIREPDVLEKLREKHKFGETSLLEESKEEF